jgi:hypothetical protein
MSPGSGPRDGDRGSTPTAGSTGGRAQTTLDFGIGVGVFVVAVAFVFAFAPGMTQPFEASTQQETAAIDRIADRVVEDLLTAPGESNELEPWCAVAFLSNENDRYDTDLAPSPPSQYPSEAANCRWDEVALDERLGLSGSKLNVRVRLVTDLPTSGDAGDNNEMDTLCYDHDNDEFVEAGVSDCDTTTDDRLLAVGPESPDSDDSVTTARRTVRLPGVLDDGVDDGLLVVEVW